jgi:hypothetical protein
MTYEMFLKSLYIHDRWSEEHWLLDLLKRAYLAGYNERKYETESAERARVAQEKAEAEERAYRGWL